MIKGTITGSLHDEDLLRSLVTEMGKFEQSEDQPHRESIYGSWEVVVTEAQLVELDPLFGRFVWTLTTI